MKLSEAIRLGAMLRPQCRMDYFVDDGSGVVGSCALGAAYEAAVGIDLEHQWVDDEKLDELFPFLTRQASCPVCGLTDRGAGIVPHLNDTNHWTREQIADWVATLEAQQEQPSQPEAVSCAV